MVNFIIFNSYIFNVICIIIFDICPFSGKQITYTTSSKDQNIENHLGVNNMSARGGLGVNVPRFLTDQRKNVLF